MSDDETRATSPISDDAVLAANRLFYEALEAADLDLMGWLWGHGGDLSCAHPGHPPVWGRKEVMGSWRSVLAHGGWTHVIATDITLVRREGLAWVTANENLLAEDGAGVASALNLFEHDGERWRLIVHHAAPVYAGP